MQEQLHNWEDNEWAWGYSMALSITIHCNPPQISLLQHQVDKLILPRDEHLRIAIVIFIVPFIVNVSTPTPI